MVILVTDDKGTEGRGREGAGASGWGVVVVVLAAFASWAAAFDANLFLSSSIGFTLATTFLAVGIGGLATKVDE